MPRPCLTNSNEIYVDIVKNVSSCIRRNVPVKFRGPSIAKVVYILYLTLIGLAAETLRIKQTDLNTGLSGLS